MREASDQDSLLANHRRVKNKDLKSGKLDKQKRTTRQPNLRQKIKWWNHPYLLYRYQEFF